jgi:hypothetical protein
MKLHLLLVATVIAAAAPLRAADPIIPSKYMTGTICRDVASAIKKGKDEHRPVWIAAWDEKFQMSPDGRKGNAAAYSLGNFYGSPETKKLLSSNFIQVFTTMANPAIQEWLDTADISHEPVYIVLDSNGALVERKHSSANAANGLQDVQGIIAKLNTK